MSKQHQYPRFLDLDYAGFRKLAMDPTLSPDEKVGFPDSYRKGFGEVIHADICRKLPRLSGHGMTVLDIGPGCSELPVRMAELCARNSHRLGLVDSPEMLSMLDNVPTAIKVPGRFPDVAAEVRSRVGLADVIIIYSVLHYVFVEMNPWRFIESALELLRPGGEMLIGDIPNISKRKRFFSSETGVAFHKTFMHTDERPEVHFNVPEPDSIDDAVMLGILARVRAAGADAYVVPQDPALPMANRREDILIRKP